MSKTNSVAPERAKIVIVGDGSVGKTCLCNTFAYKKYPEDYEPTIFENHAETITLRGRVVQMDIMDTAGQEDFAQLRVLSFRNTNCFMMCFSVVDKVTFRNLKSIWIPEVRGEEPTAKILLVGTKSDRRGKTNPKRGSMRDREVSLKSIRKLVSSEGLDGYVETSALKDGENVDHAFHEAVRIGLDLPSDEVDGLAHANEGLLAQGPLKFFRNHCCMSA